MNRALSIAVGIALAASAIGAPRYSGWRTYHFFNNAGHSFNDIYALGEGGYAMCGMAMPAATSAQYWIVRTDKSGGVLANFTYGMPGSDCIAKTIIETDQGNLLIGGRAGGKFAAALFNPRGAPIWARTYGRNWGGCNAVIELKGGGYMLAGYTVDGSASDGYLLRLDENGDPVTDANMGMPTYDESFVAMKEVRDQGVILAGQIYGQGRGDIWALKVDYNMNRLWSTETNDGDVQVVRDLVSMGPYAYGIVGSVDHHVDGPLGLQGDTKFFLQVISPDGFWGEYFTYNLTDGLYLDNCRAISKAPDGGFVLAGFRDGGNIAEPVEIVRVTNAGGLQWSRMDNFNASPVYFTGATSFNGGRVTYCGGYGSNEGLWAQSYSEHNAPEILDKSPRDREIWVLQGDSIKFKVTAMDPDGDPLTFTWSVSGGDWPANGPSTVVDFPNVGIDTVRCTVHAGIDSVSTYWVVNVRDFYIADWSPDSLDITVQRGKKVKFVIFPRAAGNDVPIYYSWLVDGAELGTQQAFTHTFEETQPSNVDAVAVRAGVADAVLWNVEVRSLIGYWTPHPRAMNVPKDTTIIFSIWPYDPEGQEPTYSWRLDKGRTLSYDDSAKITFSEPGPHQLTGAVFIGRDVDNITWDISVYDHIMGVDGSEAMLPSQTTLDAPFPNPFNSRTTVRFGLPTPAATRFLVYDLQGRVVRVLANQSMQAGYHEVQFNGAGLPAGIYVLRLQTASANLLAKAVLTK